MKRQTKVRQMRVLDVEHPQDEPGDRCMMTDVARISLAWVVYLTRPGGFSV